MAEEERICFVIAPIGPEGSKTRKRSDQILKFVIRPAAEECGYVAKRADEFSEPGMITAQVLNHTMNDPMVVADLTDWNPNVFYELAIRHAARRPFVLLFQPTNQKERMPFDVADLRAVAVDYPDWDSMDDSKANLIQAMKAAEGMAPEQIVTPISYAINLQDLTESEDPAENMLAEVVLSLKRVEEGYYLMHKDIFTLEHQMMTLLSELRSRTSIAAMEDAIDEVIRRKAM